MKKVLSIAVVALMVALVFTSCKKDPTMTDNLCYEKGWKLSALTCENPGYGPGQIKDIYAAMESLGGYELDDIMYFEADGKQYINAGDKRYDYEVEGKQGVGNWAFNDKETVLECQLNVFGAEENAPENTYYSTTKEQCDIETLDDSKMVLSHTFTIPENSTSKMIFDKPGTYTFNFTYVHAK
jgi:hypothetical protein